MLIETIFLFPIIWILGFVLHEYMHLMEAVAQDADRYSEFWWQGKLPSIRTVITGKLRDPYSFKFAGCFYTAFIFIILAILVYMYSLPIHFCLMTTGMANLIYAFYEQKYLWEIPLDRYMRYHYLIYLLVIVLMVFIYGQVLHLLW